VELRGKVWIEEDGEHLFGKGRAELLEAVDAEGSIQAAAQRLGMSYRHAWSVLRDCQERCGRRLVETERGGSDGGGARVTEFGRRMLCAYRRIESRFQRLLEDAQTELDNPGA
jgi:molybdate transport system regulatory protein